MKKKLSKIFGVGLAVILISSLFGFAVPTSAALPLPTINAWDQFLYPMEGSLAPLTSGWFWDPDIAEIGPMAKAINGDVYTYARVTGDPAGTHKILRSVDGGLSWTDSSSPWANYNVVSAIGNQVVVDMVCSSVFEDVIYVTDGSYVYKSADNATTWTVVAQLDLELKLMGACGVPVADLVGGVGPPITCLDVGYDSNNMPYVFIGVKWTDLDANPATFQDGPPDILYIDELGIGATWVFLNLSCYDPFSVYTPYAVGVTPDFATGTVRLLAVVTTPVDNASLNWVLYGIPAGPETHVISSTLGTCGWGEVAELVRDCDPTLQVNHFEIDHSSRIGYFDDYLSTFTVLVGVSSITNWNADTDTDGGDVYSVTTWPFGMAFDLNCAGSMGGCVGISDGTNICGLSVCGNTADGAVIAGAMNTNGTPNPLTWWNEPNDTFTSQDGGWNWVTSAKDPTGSIHPFATPTTSETWVQWVGDNCGETALAATRRCDCAISITCGSPVGLYWNQASLINTCFTCAYVVDHSPGYYEAGVSDTMFMLTWCSDACVRPGGNVACYSVYRYTGDPTLAMTSSTGHEWYRVFSSILYAGQIETPEPHGLLGAPIQFLQVSPDFDDTACVYIGNAGFEFFRTLDAGCTWTKLKFPCAPRPYISAFKVMNKEVVVAGGGNGPLVGPPDPDDWRGWVWTTIDHGNKAWIPSMSCPIAGCGNAMCFDFNGMNWLLSDDNSNVFLSTDACFTFNQVDLTLPAGGAFDTSVIFDPGYAVSGDPGENTFYAAAGAYIFRCIYNPDLLPIMQTWDTLWYDPGSSFWGMAVAGDTALYVGDIAAVNGDGGMVRSLNPTGFIGAPWPLYPFFERLNMGLGTGTQIAPMMPYGGAPHPANCGFSLTSGVNGCPTSNVLWAVGISASCPEVWFFEDTLALPVTLVSPVDGAKGLTEIIGTNSVVLEWDAFCGATWYEKEVWYYCPGCLDKTYILGPAYCDMCMTTVPCVGCSGETCCEVVSGLEPGVTYYWRVRVCYGSPFVSKWSEERSFTTAMLTPARCSPICGAEDITLTPNFSWSPVTGATGYEIEVSTTEDFATLVASGTPTINAWDGVPELDNDTTYYWRVRAVKDGTVGEWTYCLFSTEKAAPTPPAQVWVCPQCGLTFTSEAALLAHIDAEHGPVATPVYIWVIIAIGAALVIAVLVLIVTTRRG